MTAHSIEEYDVVRMFCELGYDVFSPGAYVDPKSPGDDMRPPIDDDHADHPELREVLERVTVTDDRPDVLWNAKDHLPDEWIDWADVIICHHVEWRWLWPQWERIKHKRVIWRTVGQSTHQNEHQAMPFVHDGLEIVRYSPKEWNLPNFAGADAMIRFYKDPKEWSGWDGRDGTVLLITQNPRDRAMWTHTHWAQKATEELEAVWVGPGTEYMGGLGKVSPDQLRMLMRSSRAMLYTGTQPASYTLALIEAMMTGMPVVSIGPSRMGMFPYSPRLFEAHCIAPLYAEETKDANELLRELIEDPFHAARVGAVSRSRAIALFGRDRIADAWDGWLTERRKPDPDPDLVDIADIEGDE